LKKPQRVFVARSGDELITEEDWVRVLKNDVVLLVSAGEDYVGLKKEVVEECKCLLVDIMSTSVVNANKTQSSRKP
jgi:predicted ThiF/HesA family dinucleotide-utilizing enzyme